MGFIGDVGESAQADAIRQFWVKVQVPVNITQG